MEILQALVARAQARAGGGKFTALDVLVEGVLVVVEGNRLERIAQARQAEPLAAELTDDQVWRYLC